MFGWHVHEKAILLVLVPLRCTLSSTTYVRELNTNIPIFSSLLAAENNAYFRTFVIASVSGIFSLFPLLFTPDGLFRLFFTSRAFPNYIPHLSETLVKVIYSVLWAILVFEPLQKKVYE